MCSKETFSSFCLIQVILAISLYQICFSVSFVSISVLNLIYFKIFKCVKVILHSSECTHRHVYTFNWIICDLTVKLFYVVGQVLPASPCRHPSPEWASLIWDTCYNWGSNFSIAAGNDCSFHVTSSPVTVLENSVRVRHRHTDII